MWLHICKLRLHQKQRAAIRQDKAVWLSIIAILLCFQVYVYQDVEADLRQIDTMAISLQRLLALAGCAVLSGSLLFLYLLEASEDRRNQTFLRRLPISVSDLYRASAIPYLIFSCCFFMIDSVGFLASVIPKINQGKSTIHFIGAYGFYVICLIEISLIMKSLLRLITSRLARRFWFVESILASGFLVIFGAIGLSHSSPKLIVLIEQFITRAMGGNTMHIIWLLLISVVLFLVIFFPLSRLEIISSDISGRQVSLPFSSSPLLNGSLLEAVQWIRDSIQLRSLLFSFLLGNAFVILPYFLFNKVENQFILFLVWTVGIGLTQQALYKEVNVRCLRRMPISFEHLVAGKGLFYTLSAILLFSVSVAVLKHLRVTMQTNMWTLYVDLIEFIMFCLLIRAFFRRRLSDNGIAETVVTIIIFAACRWLFSFLPSLAWSVIVQAAVALTSFAAYTKIYAHYLANSENI